MSQIKAALDLCYFYVEKSSERLLELCNSGVVHNFVHLAGGLRGIL